MKSIVAEGEGFAWMREHDVCKDAYDERIRLCFALYYPGISCSETRPSAAAPADHFPRLR
jgi:hypothetical protein